MTAFTKSLLGAALLSAAASAPAFATDSFSDVISGELTQSSRVQTLIDACEGSESSTRAVRACTKLIKMAPTSETRGAFTTRRALHRLALGEFESAASDFRRAGKITDNDDLASLGSGFAAMMDRDLMTARAEFEDCTTRKGLAPLAHYGLGLTYQMAGRDFDARQNYQQALVLRPNWAPVEAQMQSLG